VGVGVSERRGRKCGVGEEERGEGACRYARSKASKLIEFVGKLIMDLGDIDIGHTFDRAAAKLRYLQVEGCTATRALQCRCMVCIP
jgi:hypothetical protein